MMPINQQIKKSLRVLLPKDQYDSLVKLRQRLSSQQRDGLQIVMQTIEDQKLSDAALLDLKNAINVVKKMDYAPRDIFLHIDSMTEYDTRLRSCEKEPDTVKWIEDFMKAGDVFYDVGANVGAYSLVAAKYFAGAVRVFSFEPAFLNFTQLCRNVCLNECQEVVFPLSVVLANNTGMGEFKYHDMIPGGSLHTFGEAVDYKGDVFKPVFTQKTLSYRLDDLIDQFGIEPPTHIKIDVDGIEKAVLEGASKALSNSTLRSVIVELEEGQGKTEITDLLVAKGFSLHSEHKRWTPGMLNCIFVR